MDYNDLDPVEVLAEQVKYLIENKNGEELVSTLSAAETYLSDRKELLSSAFFESGEYGLKELDYFNAIQFYNKSRKYNPNNILVLDKIIESVSTFYFQQKEKFIKSDLLKLLPPIKMLTENYKNWPVSEHSNQVANDLLSRMLYRINFVASNAIEGPLTHRVNVIVNALEKDVPMEQVKKEVAKLIADLLKKKKSK